MGYYYGTSAIAYDCVIIRYEQNLVMSGSRSTHRTRVLVQSTLLDEMGWIVDGML